MVDDHDDCKPWTKPVFSKIGKIRDVAKVGPGTRQCGGGKGCTTKS